MAAAGAAAAAAIANAIKASGSSCTSIFCPEMPDYVIYASCVVNFHPTG
jgi:hypothetical protein